MNQGSKSILKFGTESSRKEAKYPNFVFVAFTTLKKPCDLEVNVSFEKSEREKALEKRIKLENFKTSEEGGGLKAKLDLMSPESRQIELNVINKALDFYHQKF